VAHFPPTITPDDLPCPEPGAAPARPQPHEPHLPIQHLQRSVGHLADWPGGCRLPGCSATRLPGLQATGQLAGRLSAARRVGSRLRAMLAKGRSAVLCGCPVWFRGVSMRMSGCAVLLPRVTGVRVRDTPTEAVGCAMLVASAAVVGGAGRRAAVATRRRAMGAPHQPGFLVDHELSLAWSGRFGLA
jgi:hypothetical protein